MRNYKKFNEEVTIRGNKGIPGQGQSDGSEDSYLYNLEDSELKRLGLSRSDVDNMSRMSGFGQVLMSSSSELINLSRGKEKELEKLAAKVIRNLYGDFLDEVFLNIKMVKFGSSETVDMIKRGREESKKFRTENKIKDNRDSNSAKVRKPSAQEIRDPKILNRIQRSKIAEVIMQGEAKNTKAIIQSGEVRDELKKIYKSDFNRAYELLILITDTAHKMDWIMPLAPKARAMEESPYGLAGATDVDFERKEEIEKKGDYKKMDKDPDFSLSDLDDKEVIPTINVVGVDFAMLIHEAVKGVYKLLNAILVPNRGLGEESDRLAAAIELNVSYEDEVEDFRYGPKIAADLRDFINENPKSNPMIRVYVYERIMNPDYLDDEEFLELFKGILSKSKRARAIIDSVVDEVRQELIDYEAWDVLENRPRKGYELGISDDADELESYIKSNAPNFSKTDLQDDEDLSFEDEFSDDDITFDFGSDDDDDDDDFSFDFDSDEDDEDIQTQSQAQDFSKLSQSEIKQRIDDALDINDYDTVDKLSKFLERINHRRFGNRRI